MQHLQQIQMRMIFEPHFAYCAVPFDQLQPFELFRIKMCWSTVCRFAFIVGFNQQWIFTHSSKRRTMAALRPWVVQNARKFDRAQSFASFAISIYLNHLKPFTDFQWAAPETWHVLALRGSKSGDLDATIAEFQTDAVSSCSWPWRCSTSSLSLNSLYERE